MEAAKNVFYSPLIYTPKTRGRKFSPSTSVQMINDETTVVVTSTSTTSIAQHFPASVFLQDHDLKTSLPFGREDRTASSERSLIDRAVPSCEQKKSDRYLKDFQRQLLYWPGVCYLLPPIHSDEKPLSSLRESTSNVADKVADIKLESMGSRHLDSAEPWNALTLAKEAVMASKEAAFLAENFGALNESLSPGLEHWVGQFNLEEVTVVRSQRHLERQSKKRKAPNKLNVEHSSRRVKDSGTKIDARSLNSTDPFKFFLFSHETKRLLTAKEEHDLFVQIKYLMKLEEVKGKLRAQFGHEPTLVEWAEAVGMSCRALQACMNSGNNSREKMIYANFRLVVHVAKKYQGSGLGIHDLLQVGSMGLMKGLEKFKPQAGCRFSTYAYWWIRQSIKKAIFLHSRTIRLPENVYALLKRVNVAKKSFIQKGHFPSNEDLAKSLGISVVKLERLLFTTQKPVSIQQPAWGSDQDVTFQEITADPADEILSITVDKQLMRRHVRNLLTTLTPKERQVVLLRYGIHDGEKKSLSEIGRVFGISKERVRQVENRAIEKLKKFLSSEGLEVYVDLIT
ncbi:RNA polymerase sigma factor sigF, chloroplastic isoform X2 [Aristolochia californica]|uniref:RNA polymerase sigma factor sigF, chloroplastic isoform X2 n=1 Tax=Aristolochia californica TaxID=171875 RepID=UPI0035DF9B35